MNHKFDELTKQMARSVTRRAALKKFGVGLAGMALACFGLADKATAGKGNCDPPAWFSPLDLCCCFKQGRQCKTGLPKCNALYAACEGRCADPIICLSL